jgi:hypothetical protein
LGIYKFRSFQEPPSKPAHFNWSPHLDTVTSNHIFKREKNGKEEKKTKNCGEWWKRKDGVEEVEEEGLVNNHILWRSAGGNTLEDRDMNS